MHMCMVAAAIANGGVMMEPRLLQDVTSASGVNRLKFTSATYRTALSYSLAEEIKGYMAAVVQSGTAKQAAVSGLTICGKTGSAESNDDGRPVTHGWFIGFIDDDDYPYAVAVLVEDVNDGDGGGSVAAPPFPRRIFFTYLKEKQPGFSFPDRQRVMLLGCTHVFHVSRFPHFFAKACAAHAFDFHFFSRAKPRKPCRFRGFVRVRTGRRC